MPQCVARRISEVCTASQRNEVMAGSLGPGLAYTNCSGAAAFGSNLAAAVKRLRRRIRQVMILVDERAPGSVKLKSPANESRPQSLGSASVSLCAAIHCARRM